MDFSWENGSISECRITSNSGNPCKIKYNGIGSLNVYDETNKQYVKAEASENTLEFSTTAGAVYVLTNDESLPVVTAPPSAVPSASPDNIPSATAPPDATGSEIPVNNEKKPVKIGSTVEKKSLVYKITSSSAVQLTKVRTSKKSVVIPDRITISGKKYTVTTIANNAFSGKKITKVTIGKNIQKIGRKAFANCKKLKTVIFKSVKLKSVGKQAFYKTNQKVRVKLGRKVVKKYRKMLTKGKISSKAKYVAVKLS